jgi:hypothetical protein
MLVHQLIFSGLLKNSLIIKNSNAESAPASNPPGSGKINNSSKKHNNDLLEDFCNGIYILFFINISFALWRAKG